MCFFNRSYSISQVSVEEILQSGLTWDIWLVNPRREYACPQVNHQQAGYGDGVGLETSRAWRLLRSDQGKVSIHSKVLNFLYVIWLCWTSKHQLWSPDNPNHHSLETVGNLHYVSSRTNEPAEMPGVWLKLTILFGKTGGCQAYNLQYQPQPGRGSCTSRKRRRLDPWEDINVFERGPPSLLPQITRSFICSILCSRLDRTVFLQALCGGQSIPTVTIPSTHNSHEHRYITLMAVKKDGTYITTTRLRSNTLERWRWRSCSSNSYLSRPNGVYVVIFLHKKYLKSQFWRLESWIQYYSITSFYFIQ